GCAQCWPERTVKTLPIAIAATGTATWRKRLASKDIWRGPRQCHDGGCSFGGGDVVLTALGEPELRLLRVEKPTRSGPPRGAETVAREAAAAEKTACPTCHTIHAGECL